MDMICYNQIACLLVVLTGSNSLQVMTLQHYSNTNKFYFRTCNKDSVTTGKYYVLLLVTFLSTSIFSERELKFMFAICHRRSVCLSVCRL